MVDDADRTMRWLPEPAPQDARLRPPQVVARRSRTARLRPPLEASPAASALRDRLAAAESGDVSPILHSSTRPEVRALRADSMASDDPGGLLLVVMALWCRVLAGAEAGRDTGTDENQTIAGSVQLYILDASLLPPELTANALAAGPSLLAAVAERSGDVVLLTDVARLVRHRFERFHHEGDLTEAEQMLDTLRRDPRMPLPAVTDATVELVQVLALRFEHTGCAASLDRAAELLSSLEQETAPSARADARGLGCLVYRLRYTRSGNASDLDLAVGAGTESLGLRNDPSVRNNLAVAHWQRFVAKGDRQDLRRAIETQTALLDATSQGHPARAGRASNLAASLHQAHRHTGDLDLLDDAVRRAREAVELTPPRHLDRGGYRSNLAAMLQDRFIARGAEADLGDALAALRAAVAEAGSESRHRAGFLANLGSCQARRHQALGNAADLDAAVQNLFRAVDATERGTPDHSVRLSNLAEALRSKAMESDSAALLDSAVSTAREAVGTTPHGHRDGAVHHVNLGRALADRYRRGGRDADLADARTHLSVAVDMPTAPPLLRATAAQRLAELLAGHDWYASAAAAAAAVQRFDELVDHRIDRRGRQRHLAALQGLARDGAAAALAAGDPELAVGLLEQGRGVLIAQAVESRQDLSAVREHDPRLADEIVQLGYALAGEAPDAHAREALAKRWEHAVARARRIPGNASFLAAPGLPELCAAAGDGPVVHVNVSQYRVDALVLTEAGLDVLPLPGLTAADVDAAAQRVAKATRTQSWETNETLDEVLEQLWDGLCGPVLRHLDEVTEGHGGRMWWVPGGSPALLPLPATGLHRTVSPPDRALRERWTCSYAPTVRALRQQRAVAVDRLDTSRPVVVAVPGEGPSALREVVAEAEQVTAVLGSAHPLLLGRKATRAAVAAALPAGTCAHIACHAVSEPDPLESRLLLADEPLTVRDLLSLHPADASLAFLSACTTADPGRELVDEVLHISTAFQVAGYPHVIGTLWPIDDEIAPTVARNVYTGLARRHPAEALHHVLCTASREYEANPFLWASYVHLGP